MLTKCLILMYVAHYNRYNCNSNIKLIFKIYILIIFTCNIDEFCLFGFFVFSMFCPHFYQHMKSLGLYLKSRSSKCFQSVFYCARFTMNSQLNLFFNEVYHCKVIMQKKNIVPFETLQKDIQINYSIDILKKMKGTFLSFLEKRHALCIYFLRHL